MTNPLIVQAVADDYRRDRIAEAARSRLVRLASCWRPSTLARVAGRVRALATYRGRPELCCA
jgi:hypothetical protein